MISLRLVFILVIYIIYNCENNWGSAYALPCIYYRGFKMKDNYLSTLPHSYMVDTKKIRESEDSLRL